MAWNDRTGIVIRVQTGSISQATKMQPVDADIRANYPPDVSLDSTVLEDGTELLTPTAPALKFYPLPLDTGSFESAYEGRTLRWRLERVVMPRVVALVTGINELAPFIETVTIDGRDVTGVKLHHAVQYLCDLITAEYSWALFETVPELHYPVVGASDTPIVTAIVIPQELEDRRSVLQVLEQLTELTPALMTANSAGKLEFIPLYGPDAYPSGNKVLTTGDIQQPLLIPKPDPRGIVNACIYSERVLGFVGGSEVMQAAGVITHIEGYDGDEADIPVYTRYELDSDAEKDGRQYLPDNPNYRTVWGWPLDDDTLITNGLIFIETTIEGWVKNVGDVNPPTHVGVLYTSDFQTVTLTADAAVNDTSISVDPIAKAIGLHQGVYFANQAFTVQAASIGATTLNLEFPLKKALLTGDVGMTGNNSVLALTGERKQMLNLFYTHTVGLAETFTQATLYAHYEAATRRVVFELIGVQLDGENALWAGTPHWTLGWQFNAYGSAFGDTGREISARFGYDLTQDILQDGAGNDVLGPSQSIWGVREAQIRSSFLNIGLDQAYDLCRAYVANNINPKFLWRLEQSYEWQVSNDDIGQKIELPNGAVGVLRGRSYADSRRYDGATVQSGLELDHIGADLTMLDLALGFPWWPGGDPDVPLRLIKVNTRGTTTYYDEASYSAAPLQEGQTGNGTVAELTATMSRLTLWNDWTLELAIWNGSSWEIRNPTGHPLFGVGVTLPVGARHVTHCWDQSFRLIIAYEIGGQIKVTRWDETTNQYVQNVSFTGVDPLLFMDATSSFRIPNSDVVMFYLDAARLALNNRLQRDDYGVEYAAAGLTGPAYLDQAVALPYQLELLLEDAAAEKALLSAWYPYVAALRVLVSYEFSGSFDFKAFRSDGNTERALVTHEFLSGLYQSLAEQYASSERATVTHAIDSGSYDQKAFQHASSERATVTHAIDSGSYDQVGFRHEATERVTVTPQFSGGTYATP